MTLQITGNNMTGSPELVLSGGSSVALSWSPFGSGVARTGATASLLGFNGERQDPLTGTTHLGNGYRAYNPALRRFTCPDSESPFGVGGINPYVYCDSDPTNKIDPDGHMPVGGAEPGLPRLIERRNAVIAGQGATFAQASGDITSRPVTNTISAGTASAAPAATGQSTGAVQRRRAAAATVPVTKAKPELSDFYKAPAYVWAIDSNSIQNASNRKINISQDKERINIAMENPNYLKRENKSLYDGLESMRGLSEKQVSDKLNQLILTEGAYLPPKKPLYRGMKRSDVGEVGSIVGGNKFTATSSNYKIAERFAKRNSTGSEGGAIIQVVGGKPMYIPNVYNDPAGNEYEYLYSRNTRFRVTQDPKTKVITYNALKSS